jgi:large subunit ribosomal protein L23
MLTIYDVIKKPIVTEKGHDNREQNRTLCFAVAEEANKIQIKSAVETLFKVKVEDVRTAVFEGKLRRRGRFAGYRSTWKKAFVRLKDGQKVPEYNEI